MFILFAAALYGVCTLRLTVPDQSS